METPCIGFFVVGDDQLTFAGVLEMLCALTMAAGSVRASRRLFTTFYCALQRAPMLFFDTTPRGRILNRVAEDVSCIDRVMPFTVRSMINCVLAGFVSIFVVAYATTWFLTSIPPLAIVYYFIQVKWCHLSAKRLHSKFYLAFLVAAVQLLDCILIILQEMYHCLLSCLSACWLAACCGARGTLLGF